MQMCRSEILATTHWSDCYNCFYWNSPHTGKDRAILIWNRLFNGTFLTAEEVKIAATKICRKVNARYHQLFATYSEFHSGYWGGCAHLGWAGEIITPAWLSCWIKNKQQKDLLIFGIKTISKIIERENGNMKTTGELRVALARALNDAREGKLTGDALRGVIGAANQINSSMSVEIKLRRQLQSEGAQVGAWGEAELGN